MAESENPESGSGSLSASSTSKQPTVPRGAVASNQSETPSAGTLESSAPRSDTARPPKRRKRRKWPWIVSGTIVVVVVLAWIGFNCFAAYWIAHNGYTGQSEPNVSTIGFSATNVTYGDGLVAWYSPPAAGQPIAVIVHGYQANRSHVLGTAQALRARGYGVMLPDLAYVSGKTLFGGGDREASEVIDAVNYVHSQSAAPVVLIGYSEGGAEAILAAERGAKVDAVVSDSAPVSFLSIAAEHIDISQTFFAAAYIVYPWFSGGAHLENLASVLPGTYHVPTLVIQGTADTTVPYADGPTLARLTHGQLWTVTGAGHDQAFAMEPTAYTNRITAFFQSAIASHS